MDSHAVKDLMFGGVAEMLKNHKLYYRSEVGADYCHFTEEGKKALHEYMNLMAYKMLEAEEVSLNKRAKELVINGLKGESV
jgi:hypothetical protein